MGAYGTTMIGVGEVCRVIECVSFSLSTCNSKPSSIRRGARRVRVNEDPVHEHQLFCPQYTYMYILFPQWASVGALKVPHAPKKGNHRKSLDVQGSIQSPRASCRGRSLPSPSLLLALSLRTYPPRAPRTLVRASIGPRHQRSEVASDGGQTQTGRDWFLSNHHKRWATGTPPSGSGRHDGWRGEPNYQLGGQEARLHSSVPAQPCWIPQVSPHPSRPVTYGLGVLQIAAIALLTDALLLLQDHLHDRRNRARVHAPEVDAHILLCQLRLR